MFHGLIAKMLSQEEQDLVSAQYQKLKNDPTLSTTDKTKPLVDAYYFALHRLNKVSSTNTWGSQGPGVPPKEVTLKREWLSVTPNGENSDIFRWHLIPNNDDKRI